MSFSSLKKLLPNRDLPVPILKGPFRGAVVCMNPRYSLRKVFGLYEHELNPWLSKVLPHVGTVLDVGANDGYFTFGCAAALQRLNRPASIIAFEPQEIHFRQLQASLQRLSLESVQISLRQTYVGKRPGPNMTMLDELTPPRCPALIKIDVEGAEVDVLEGASRWLKPQNYFLIEVHQENYLSLLKAKFSTIGITLLQQNQIALPLLGRETRDEKNWWLISQLR